MRDLVLQRAFPLSLGYAVFIFRSALAVNLSGCYPSTRRDRKHRQLLTSDSHAANRRLEAGRERGSAKDSVTRRVKVSIAGSWVDQHKEPPSFSCPSTSLGADFRGRAKADIAALLALRLLRVCGTAEAAISTSAVPQRSCSGEGRGTATALSIGFRRAIRQPTEDQKHLIMKGLGAGRTDPGPSAYASVYSRSPRVTSGPRELPVSSSLRNSSAHSREAEFRCLGLQSYSCGLCMSRGKHYRLYP